MSTAYAYVRFSTAAQGAEGRDSETRQLAPLAAFEQDFGLKIDQENIVYDRGKSAFDGSNALKGNLKSLLEKLEEDDFLVVESIDRLTRQRVLNGVELIQNLLKRGIKLYTTSDKKLYEVSDPSRDLETLLLISVIAKRANEESEIKSIRRKSAYRKARILAETEKQIFNKNSPPFGVRYDANLASFVEEKDEADDIRKIFELLKDFGVDETVRRINEHSQRRRWTNKALFFLIKNKSPLGTLAVFTRLKKDGKEKRVFEKFIDNYYPQIVSNADFQSALNAMQSRKKERIAGRYSQHNFNIFKSCIFCAECNSSMTFTKTRVSSKANDGGYTYLICKNKKETRNCSAKNIRFEYAFGALLELNNIFNSVKQSEFSSAISKTVGLFKAFSYEKEKNSEAKKEINTKLKEKAIAENRLANINASINFDERIPSSIIVNMSKLEEQIEKLSKEISLLDEQHKFNTTIDAETARDIYEIFKTENGRLMLNRFFIENKISFKMKIAQTQQKEKYLDLHLYREKDAKSWLNVGFTCKQKKPLSDFGFNDLSDIINIPPKL